MVGSDILFSEKQYSIIQTGENDALKPTLTV